MVPITVGTLVQTLAPADDIWPTAHGKHSLIEVAPAYGRYVPDREKI